MLKTDLLTLLSSRVILVIVALLLPSCVTTSKLKKPEKVNHIYLEPTTNRTSEELADIIFTRAASNAFYTDSRFIIDRKPIPGTTIMVKPLIEKLDIFSVGFDREDIAVEYRMTITVTIKLKRAGFKKPFKILTIKRYDFYNARGNPEDIERRKKECMERIAIQIFREVGERLLYEEQLKNTKRTKG